MRTKAWEWRRTCDSKRTEEQHCCSSKYSHFNEEEISLVPPSLAPCFSIHGCLHSSKILKVLCQVKLSLGEVPAGTPCGSLPCAPTAEGPCCRERFGQDLISAGGERPLQWGVATGAWCDPMSWGDPSTDWFDLQSQMPVTQVWLLTLVLGRVSAPSAAGTHSFPLSFTLFGKYIIFPQLL